jgi:hypothetical protein
VNFASLICECPQCSDYEWNYVNVRSAREGQKCEPRPVRARMPPRALFATPVRSFGWRWFELEPGRPYLEVATGSIPLRLIVSDARGEARNSIRRLAPSISFEPATTAAANIWTS